MATGREKKIIELIEENPQISQQEIALRCGIARSSVAVHISNLMKKGIILGKGYVVRHEPYVLVLGGQNIDIYGRPSSVSSRNDSTPGKIRMSDGGVGRNIAFNLALLGESVKFITAFGEDHNAEELERKCRRAGIDVSSSLTVAGASTSTYLFITNTEGEMELAVSDMEIYEEMKPEFFESKLNIIKRAAICVVDTNLPVKSLEYLLSNSISPIFVDAVSTVKAKKLVGLLDKIHTLKVNRIEAELLTGIAITDVDTARKAANVFLKKGIAQIFITLGEDGVFAAGAKEEVSMLSLPLEVKNTTGAGDSFMAALVWAWRKNFSIEESAKAGLAASNICMDSVETVSPQISAKRVLEIMGKYSK